MINMNRVNLALFAGVATFALATSVGHAAPMKKVGDYPKRTISIIVPYGAGGGSDQVARAWADSMQKITGVGFQVENKPGGGGIAAIPDYMSRPADGYTILQQTDGLITAGAAKQISYALNKDIVPICITQSTFNQIYIHPDDTRFTDWKSFLAYAKAHPGQLKMANIQTAGAMERIQVDALEEGAGFKTNQISFDKPTERYASLIGKQVDVMLEQPGDVRSFVEAGQIKPILTILNERPAKFAKVPSLNDVGLEKVPVLQRVRAFWLNGKVSKERMEYLQKACKTAFDSADYQAFNKKKYMDLARSYYDSKDAEGLVDKTISTYQTFYKKLGLLK